MIQETARSFTVADLNARGELHARQNYRYADLEAIPLALELIAAFSSAIWKSPDGFELDPIAPGAGVDCRWRASASTAGIVTLRCGGELASLSLLASGKVADADQITLAAFQRYLLQELHDTGYEPAFDLVGLTERPLVATINIRSPDHLKDQMMIALADRCFAASYFRFHQLV